MLVPFSSLSPDQQARAAALFRDDLFGNDPAGFAYEVDAAGLIGQRSRLEPVGDHRHDHRPSTPPVRILTSGACTLSDQAASYLARLLIQEIHENNLSTLAEELAIA